MYSCSKKLVYLSLDEMTDPHFGHDRNGNGFDDRLDHVWVALEMEEWAYVLATRMHGDGALHLPYARHRLKHEYLQAHALVP